MLLSSSSSSRTSILLSQWTSIPLLVRRQISTTRRPHPHPHPHPHPSNNIGTSSTTRTFPMASVLVEGWDNTFHHPYANRFLNRTCNRRWNSSSSFLTSWRSRKDGSHDPHSRDSSSSASSRITIGDISVPSPMEGSGRPDLIPTLHPNPRWDVRALPNAYISPLRWMLQKDFILQQDFLFVGPPALARDRRHLVFLYAALTEREIEYVSLSRDTSDADLKQRKEVLSSNSTSSSSSSIYIHQGPVRAALHGRLLILDGLEKVERNVLPTLNNLLENREMSLDDGSLLVASHIYDDYYNNYNNNQERNTQSSTSTPSPSITNQHHQIHRVHPNFRVVALTSDTSTLDPPLRSRFQAHAMTYLDPGDIYQHLILATTMNTTNKMKTPLDPKIIQELVQLATTIPQGISLQSLHDAINYLLYTPNSLKTPTSVLNAYLPTMLTVQDCSPTIRQRLNDLTTSSHSLFFIPTNTTQAVQDLVLTAFESGQRGVALVGPKGCYKSSLVRDLVRNKKLGSTENDIQIRLFSLYSDMTARDLLLTRGTDIHGTTIWRKTPLTTAIETGTWVVLDGIDKLSSDTLTSLALLLEQGQMDLPDGTRLMASPNFRCIVLAHPHDDKRNSWVSPEVMGMFHFISVDPLPSDELQDVLSGLYPSIDRTTLKTLVHLRDRLDEAIQGGAADTLEEQQSLLLSMRKLKHVCKRIVPGAVNNNDNKPKVSQNDVLIGLLENAMMIDLMPDREKKIVQTCMEDCGLIKTQPLTDKRTELNGQVTWLDQGILENCRRTPQNLLLVPNPVFEENENHLQVLKDILDAHYVGEEALLIMGFQGVGKNRIVDYLLSLLSCEREYLQLHRDTTVQSILSSPSVEDGRIVYHDSPLVRAAKHGRILVIDEADKAPVEVVALLKGLIEDRELALPDGRMLRYDDDSKTEIDLEGTIQIHPDFRIWALANPASYPFHGNDISGEMSDVFSCHMVPSLDSDSQRRILKRYGPELPHKDIDTILQTWHDLRTSYEKGIISYPFSVREAVSITKHLNRFPTDGLSGAFENVIAFDRFDSVTLRQLANIFNRHGIPMAMLGSTAEMHKAHSQGGISTPRTRASSPKHGKIDKNNDPHVGGNTWAGGSGGSDTAGLGGRGGPYRLDSGHPVHQVSNEMKAQVSKEAIRRARQLAKEGLEQKLKELDMNKLDWDRYNNLQERVAPQIQQLRVYLADIKRRKQERTWLKRQSTGEIDDSRLVDALAGERDVFKKRGKSMSPPSKSQRSLEPMNIKLVVDISASMYRFNGYDGRLQTLLEATLMIMEALKDDDRFSLSIVGHNGDSPEIPLVLQNTPRDPKTQLKVLEGMVAHTQYTFAGDHTVEAIEHAVAKATDGDLVIVISDANLRRYRIDPKVISYMLNQPGVHAHLVLIGNFGEEARNLAHTVSNERAQVCLDSADLPLILKKIVSSAAK